MSSQMKVTGINLPENPQVLLTNFATAKDPTAPSFLSQAAISLKSAFKDRTQQPTGEQVLAGVEILKKLRSMSSTAIDAGKSAHKTASVNDRKIFGLWFRLFGSEQACKIDTATAALVKSNSNLAAVQKQYETLQTNLESMRQKAEARQEILVVKAGKPVGNEEIRANLKPSTIWVNGVKQESLETLFKALLPGAEQGKVDSRVKTFGEAGIIPQLDGDDLKLLACSLPSRFTEMAEAFTRHLNKAEFTNDDGSNFFVGHEVEASRKIVIEDGKVRHETTFELKRDNAVVATVGAKLAFDGTECRFENIQVKYSFANKPDYEGLLRIFKKPAVAKVAEASVAAQ